MVHRKLALSVRTLRGTDGRAVLGGRKIPGRVGMAWDCCCLGAGHGRWAVAHRAIDDLGLHGAAVGVCLPVGSVRGASLLGRAGELVVAAAHSDRFAGRLAAGDADSARRVPCPRWTSLLVVQTGSLVVLLLALWLAGYRLRGRDEVAGAGGASVRHFTISHLLGWTTVAAVLLGCAARLRNPCWARTAWGAGCTRACSGCAAHW